VSLVAGNLAIDTKTTQEANMMMKQGWLPYAAAAFTTLTAGLALSAGAVYAQQTQSAAEGIDAYRQALQQGNPAELVEARGEALWKQKRGPKNVSLEQCDLGKGPGKVAGAYAELPRYFKDTDSVMNLETRLVHCMVTLQGFNRADLVKKPYSSEGERQTDLESLVAFIVSESRGMPMNVPQAHAKEKESFARGQKVFWYRAGPYDFNCASCHSGDNQRIRLQDLPNLLSKEKAQLAYTTWPAYRVSQGAVRTWEWRLYDCFRQMRFPELQYNSQAAVDLTTFLAVNANGGKMAAPAIKR
jgi:sulfur-oxidizing protein SoxA